MGGRGGEGRGEEERGTTDFVQMQKNRKGMERRRKRTNPFCEDKYGLRFDMTHSPFGLSFGFSSQPEGIALTLAL